jgi:hypothetical protein
VCIQVPCVYLLSAASTVTRNSTYPNCSAFFLFLHPQVFMLNICEIRPFSILLLSTTLSYQILSTVSSFVVQILRPSSVSIYEDYPIYPTSFLSSHLLPLFLLSSFIQFSPLQGHLALFGIPFLFPGTLKNFILPFSIPHP